MRSVCWIVAGNSVITTHVCEGLGVDAVDTAERGAGDSGVTFSELGTDLAVMTISVLGGMKGWIVDLGGATGALAGTDPVIMTWAAKGKS